MDSWRFDQFTIASISWQARIARSLSSLECTPAPPRFGCRRSRGSYRSGRGVKPSPGVRALPWAAIREAPSIPDDRSIGPVREMPTARLHGPGCNGSRSHHYRTHGHHQGEVLGRLGGRPVEPLSRAARRRAGVVAGLPGVAANAGVLDLRIIPAANELVRRAVDTRSAIRRAAGAPARTGVATAAGGGGVAYGTAGRTEIPVVLTERRAGRAGKDTGPRLAGIARRGIAGIAAGAAVLRVGFDGGAGSIAADLAVTAALLVAAADTAHSVAAALDPHTTGTAGVAVLRIGLEVGACTIAASLPLRARRNAYAGGVMAGQTLVAGAGATVEGAPTAVGMAATLSGLTRGWRAAAPLVADLAPIADLIAEAAVFRIIENRCTDLHSRVGRARNILRHSRRRRRYSTPHRSRLQRHSTRRRSRSGRSHNTRRSQQFPVAQQLMPQQASPVGQQPPGASKQGSMHAPLQQTCPVGQA